MLGSLSMGCKTRMGCDSPMDFGLKSLPSSELVEKISGKSILGYSFESVTKGQKTKKVVFDHILAEVVLRSYEGMDGIYTSIKVNGKDIITFWGKIEFVIVFFRSMDVSIYIHKGRMKLGAINIKNILKVGEK